MSGALLQAASIGIKRFNVTNNGRIAADGHLVVALDADITAGLPPANASASADTDIWVEVTSGEATIYCGGLNATWTDDSGTNQGDPGSRGAGGTSVFTLGAEPDEIRITKSGESTSSTAGGTAGVNKIGTFTDNSFFSPTASTEYGYQTDTSASDSTDDGTSESGDATVTVTFTFRKAGYEDYSISFSQDASSSAQKGIS